MKSTINGKRVFVSGGAGVIGNALVEKLIQLGAKVMVGDLKPRPIDLDESIIYRRGDLNYISKEELDSFAPDYFFHLAATFERSKETYEFWNLNYEHNISLSHHLMSCLKESKTLKRIVFASSYLVYNPRLYSFPIPGGKAIRLKETDALLPRNTCGAAKLLHEIELEFLTNFKHMQFSSVCARIFRVYGKNSNDVISRWIRDLLNGRTLTVYKPENRFDYIHADDAAEGLLRLALSSISGVVNLGTDKSYSISEILGILRTNFPDMKTTNTEEETLYESSQANMDYFKDAVKWLPQTRLEDSIPILIKFEKNNKKRNTAHKVGFNILVTSISKKVPLLRAVAKAKNKLGITGKIFGADLDPHCIGRYFVDEFWIMPRIDNLHADDFVKYCKTNNINCVIPSRDGELLFFAQHKEYFKRQGIHIMISDFDSIKTCLDKLEFYRKLHDTGFPVIETTKNIADIDCDLYVVKDQFGSGSRTIGKEMTHEKAIEHAKKISNPIFQPFVSGKEFSVDLYLDKRGKPKGVITRTREAVVDGESQITSSIRNSTLEDLCSTLAMRLNLYGHVVIQLIQDSNNNPHILECNPRFGGASTLSLELGLDSLYWFLLESVNEDLENFAFIRSDKEKTQIRYKQDLLI